ncbi:MAG: hypothetical protein PWQ58_279 [Archaeoglobaceae archaeon]|nr:hypothetical protein [Archaeoglobaceae archaeon]
MPEIVGIAKTLKYSGGHFNSLCGGCRVEKAQGLRPCPEGVRGFESRPPHAILSAFKDFLEKLHLKNISIGEIKAYERDISEFLELCCYQINVKSIIIYITN